MKIPPKSRWTTGRHAQLLGLLAGKFPCRRLYPGCGHFDNCRYQRTGKRFEATGVWCELPVRVSSHVSKRESDAYSEWIFISLLFQQPPDALRHVLCGSRPHNLSLRHIFVSAAPRYDIEGKLQVGEMVLTGVDHTASTDGGKTWNPWFDLLFRPHKP